MQRANLLLFGVLLSCVDQSISERNNVCNTMEDYNSIEGNPNCRYNYVADLSVPEIIKKSGRPLETHTVRTDDGYILTVFRIPNNKRKHPVFLQHGLITTCENWIGLGEASLAFQLYDNGYDVWLGNYRGSHYSQKHVKYTVDDREYWNHSMDELGAFDIPAVLKHIMKVTGDKAKILYIGHSLGSTGAIMYNCDNASEAAKLIKLQILLAPVHTMPHMKSLFRYAVPFADFMFDIVQQYDGFLSTFSKEKTTRGVAEMLCLDSPAMMGQCMSLILSIYGVKTGIKPDMYPMYFHQHPAGSSLHVWKHCADMARGYFRKLDFGAAENMKRYGSPFPPDYDVSKIRTPTIVILAKNDYLAPREDVIKFYRLLSPEIRRGLYEINDEEFNHMDFFFGSKAKRLFVDEVLQLLEKYN